MTIPGVTTYHTRASWEPWAMPYTIASLSPPRQNAGAITQPVAHYTAADNLIDGDPGEHIGDMPRYIGNIQRDYATSRGYSVGYLFAIDYLGGVWELRGFDYKSAANAGHNEYTCPILMLVDGNDGVTAYAAASARAVWREFRRRALRADFKNRPLGHGELYLTTGVGTPTPCPGTGVLTQLHNGVLDLDREVPKEPEMKQLPADRLVDTRGPADNYDRYKIKAKTELSQMIPGAAGCAAAQLTFTVLQPAGNGHLTAWGIGDRPETSFNNYGPAQPLPLPQTLFVPLEPDGSFNYWSLASTHLLIDFTGICLL
jgi:hypothetical protein